MKIGIDAFFLSKEHNGGGKEQVLLTLLQGFQDTGVAQQFHIFCYDYSENLLRRLIPDSAFSVLPHTNFLRKKLLSDFALKTLSLRRLIKTHGVDLMFFPHYNTGITRLPVPSVILPHDIQSVSYPRRFTLKDRWLYHLIYTCDFHLRTKIVAISEFDRNEMLLHYPQYRSKIVLKYNPVIFNYKLPRTEGPYLNPYICAINIDAPHKNALTLIKAYQMISHKMKHDLVLIGRIDLKKSPLVSYVNDHQLQSRIHFTGYVQDDELNALLCNASVYINPSFFEGFGLAAIEAALRCVPVIVSDAGASKEVTMSLLNYYSPPDNTTALAEKISEVISSPPRTALLEAIRDQFQQKYSHTTISMQYFEFFKELLSCELP